MIKTFVTYSAKETALLGENLGKIINNKCVIAFRGGLGVGKTCFASGLCKGLGYNGDVTSPTFAIVNEYLGGKMPIYHFDMYRIGDEDELYSLGFYDYLDERSVMILEWSENIEAALPSDTIFIEIKTTGENEREISIIFKEGMLECEHLQ